MLQLVWWLKVRICQYCANRHTRTKLTRLLHIGIKNENLPGDTFVDHYLINYSQKGTCCHFGVKQGQIKLKIATVTNFGTEISIIISIFNIDNIFINYSQKVTYCHFGVKQGQMKLKIATVTNFGTENSIITSIFNIYNIFINYSQRSDMLSNSNVNQSQTNLKSVH